MRATKTKPTRRRKKSAEGLAESLAGPVLQFDLASEIEALRQEEAWLQTGRNSSTLVKHPDFRVVLAIMKAGTQMHEHKADARISIHSLKGRLRLRLPDQTVDLPAGHLLALDRGTTHDVEAVKESALLLTLSWPKGNR